MTSKVAAKPTRGSMDRKRAQTYLTPLEKAQLKALANHLHLSDSEALREGFKLLFNEHRKAVDADAIAAYEQEIKEGKK